jgi:hypothetical protein
MTLPNSASLDEGRLSNIDNVQPTHPAVDYDSSLVSSLVPSLPDVSIVPPGLKEPVLSPSPVVPPLLIGSSTNIPMIPLVTAPLIVPTPSPLLIGDLRIYQCFH